MKKIFLYVLLFLLSLNISYGYTNEKGDIESVGNDVNEYETAVYYPNGFMDGSILDSDKKRKNGTEWLANRPLGVGRAYWNKKIDGSDVNCLNDGQMRGIEKDKNRKCFPRHVGVWAKSDISGIFTYYPTVHNTFVMTVDGKLNS